jgi:hypothetical protein
MACRSGAENGALLLPFNGVPQWEKAKQMKKAVTKKARRKS